MYINGNKFENILIDDVLHPIQDGRIKGDCFKYYSLQTGVQIGVPFSSDALNELKDINEHIEDGCSIFCKSTDSIFLLNKIEEEAGNISLIFDTAVINNVFYQLELQINSDNELISGIINKVTIGSGSQETLENYTNIKEDSKDPSTGVVISQIAKDLAEKVLNDNSPTITITQDGISCKQYILSNKATNGDYDILRYTSALNEENIYIVGKPPIGAVSAAPVGALITNVNKTYLLNEETYNTFADKVIDHSIGYDNSEDAKKLGEEILKSQNNIISIHKNNSSAMLVSEPEEIIDSYLLVLEKDGVVRFENQNKLSIDVIVDDNKAVKGILIRKNTTPLLKPNDTYIGRLGAIKAPELEISINNETICINKKVINLPIDNNDITFEPFAVKFETDTNNNPFTLTMPQYWKIEYSFDGVTWFNNNSSTLPTTKKIYVRSIDKNYSLYGSGTIQCNGTNVIIGGDLKALYRYDTNANSISLFQGQEAYIDASDLIVNVAGSSVFENCSNLKYAPKITYINIGSRFFKGCTSLIRGMDMVVDVLDSKSMYEGCTNLIEPPHINFNKIGECTDMFSGCTKLTSTPAMIIHDFSIEGKCQGMFNGCIELEKADNILILSTNDDAFVSMFNNCKKLTLPPTLSAVDLSPNCYKNMFNGCTSLINPPHMSSYRVNNVGCCSSMFEGCTSLKTTPNLSIAFLAQGCYERMFKNCTSLNIPPQLPATIFPGNCYSNMFEGCSGINWTTDASNGVPYRLPSKGTGSEPDITSFVGMFKSNTGSIPEGTGTPLVNTTYYYTV